MKKDSSQGGGGGAHPLHPPPRSAPENERSAGRPKIHSIVLQSPNKPDTSDLQRIGTTRVYILGAYVAGKERKSILIQT